MSASYYSQVHYTSTAYGKCSHVWRMAAIKHLTFIDSYAHTKKSPYAIISGDDVTPLKKRAIFVHFSLGVCVLWEAHRADVQAKLLIGLSNIHGGQVHHGQPDRSLSPVLDHCLAPLAIWFLGRRKPDKSIEVSSNHFLPNLDTL